MITIKDSKAGDFVTVDDKVYRVLRVEGSVAFISRCVEVSAGVFVPKKGRPTKVTMENVNETVQ